MCENIKSQIAFEGFFKISIKKIVLRIYQNHFPQMIKLTPVDKNHFNAIDWDFRHRM